MNVYILAEVTRKRIANSPSEPRARREREIDRFASARHCGLKFVQDDFGTLARRRNIIAENSKRNRFAVRRRWMYFP